MVRKIRLFTPFLILLFFFLCPLRAFAAESIDSLQVLVKVHPDSSIDIRETINYNFGDAYRHGIFREIPYTTTNKEGKKFKFDIKIQSVKDFESPILPYEGRPIQYSKSIQNESIVLKIGDPNKTITGKHAYVISYTVKGAFTYFSDHDELYWNAIGTGWQVPINSAFTTIDLSELSGVKLANKDAVCYVGAQGSISQDCKIVLSGGTVQIQSTRILNPYEGLTFAISLPIGVVEMHEPAEYNPLFWIIVAILVILFLNFIATITVILIWYYKGRDPKDDRVLVRMYDSPKDKNGLEMTPLEMGTIIDETADTKDITAELIYLAIHKYIVIKEDDKKKTHLLRGPNFNDAVKMAKLKTHQTDLIAALGLDKKEDVNLSNLSQSAKLWEATEEIKTQMYKKLTDDGYFASNPKNTRTKYFLIGCAMFFLLLIIPGVLMMIFSYFMPKRTQIGLEAKRHAFGLKQFLTSQERQFEFQEKNFYLFEKLLPFAISFGVAKIWAGRFADLLNYNPDWYQSNASGNFTTVALVDSLDRGIIRASNSAQIGSRATATRVSSSTGHSSGFGGGGFSGGGGGGGGGGSW